MRIRRSFGPFTVWALMLMLVPGQGFATDVADSDPRKSAMSLGGDDGAGVLVIGLDADMSSGSAEAGEAIRRGATLAINEINNAGGILGRELRLEVKDHHGNPARGIDNLEAFSTVPNLVAVIGGLHTPVMLAELETIHHHELISLVPWAAGTPIIDNGYSPNYVFRVSVRDEFAGGVLIEHAKQAGFKKPGLLLERTGWGTSNQAAITDAIESAGLSCAGTQWFDWGVSELTREINSLVKAGADCLILVANPNEGIVAIRDLAMLPEDERLPVISHWGITGAGRTFYTKTQAFQDKIDLVFLQSYSFIAPRLKDRASHVIGLYSQTFEDYKTPQDIFSPAGTAHAYELVHLLAKAMRQSERLDRPGIRESLERLGAYQGLIRDYDPPFTSTRHDALTRDDLLVCRFNSEGAIVPVAPAKQAASR